MRPQITKCRLDVQFFQEKRHSMAPSIISPSFGDDQLLAPPTLFDINSEDHKGMTSLMKATLNNHTDIVGILIKFGANTRLKNKKGETALHIACMNENLAICELLIIAMCDVNVKDPQGRTPIMYAAKHNK